MLESEIVTDAALDASDPSEEDFEDFTGNAGMQLERWYHRAAVVVWPREEHFAVLCGAGIDAAFVAFCKQQGWSSFERELRLPLKKERRQHLHRIIDSNSCDLKHVTERRGRPYTLVCTKTLASYQRAHKNYVRDMNNSARIESLTKRLPE